MTDQRKVDVPERAPAVPMVVCCICGKPCGIFSPACDDCINSIAKGEKL